MLTSVSEIHLGVDTREGSQTGAWRLQGPEMASRILGGLKDSSRLLLGRGCRV